MSNHEKFEAGARFPDLSWQQVGGGRVSPADAEGWRLLVVYRGKHCPLCTMYLGQLESMKEDFSEADIGVWALSADPLERAEAHVKENGWTFPVLAGMSEADMRALGLYVSEPLSADETDRKFAEPGTFVINPAGEVQIVDVSNAPFSRPDLKVLLGGVKYVGGKDYPVRGTAE